MKLWGTYLGNINTLTHPMGPEFNRLILSYNIRKLSNLLGKWMIGWGGNPGRNETLTDQDMSRC